MEAWLAQLDKAPMLRSSAELAALYVCAADDDVGRRARQMMTDTGASLEQLQATNAALEQP